jgi:DNA end-binding protein Ku
VEDMKAKWEPEEYRDTFQEKILALVDTKVAQGKIETEADEAPRKSADIIDLTELLKRSLGGGKKAAKSDSKKPSSSEKTRAKNDSSEKSVAKTSSAAKTATKKTTSSKPKRAPKTASSK